MWHHLSDAPKLWVRLCSSAFLGVNQLPLRIQISIFADPRRLQLGFLWINASMLPILYHDYFDLDRIVKSRHSRYPSPSVGVIGSVGMEGQQIVKASFRDISKTT